MTIEFVKSEIRASIEVKNQVLDDEKLMEQVAQLADRCVGALKEGGKIIFCGNGGSFGDSQHLAAELVSRLRFDRLPLASIALASLSEPICL